MIRMWWQSGKFAVVGLINTGLDAGLFLILTRLAEAPALVASAFSFLAGNVNSYFMNKLWTFDDQAVGIEKGGQYARFVLVSLTVMGVHQACLVFFHHGLGLWDVAAKGIGIMLGFVLGFSLNRFWVFPRRAANHKSESNALALQN
ncbi:MAG: GtrA family protein [candidate division KSB1 bacterium]|nr:GtrA family protein [candidate division KSB1 bacterium]MDZ7365332.1 GtrA family protein [candidate division KSB1 bacterium]MDZ7403199.1 GtrA family protein [candidate division KSB1 bacterium]